ncbi:peptidoglycan editing factor PgeF [Pseudanabaena sp. PCC 6802]|uniref:peptidoglycan editing factor PgeF n=1 Tax=Pseudanabaena sp. PCC 6802 TaxID=118173 RepID=UPI00034CD4E1|nr:peptidoglycan editing factor PgeF [Pseudanabaena sp. PCC 6802]
MNNWQWQNEVLVCDLLSDWRHGFFTRSHAPHTPDRLHQFLHAEGKAYRAKQVHGDRVLHNTEIAPDLPLPEADGVCAFETEDMPRSVWVCTADCVPVLIGDRRLGSVAAVHAGWRGTASKILAVAIAKFLERGSQLDDLCVALGPAISGDAYQVSQEVADRVLLTIATPQGISIDPQPDRCRLDLRAVQRQQLIEMGIAKERIAIAPYCTLTDARHFFSYRRNCLEDPGNISRSPQVQWSGIATAQVIWG